MAIMHSTGYISLLLTLILAIITAISSAPIYEDIDRLIQSPIGSVDQLDDDYYISYPQPSARRKSNNLERGYYYIDNGSITPVNSQDALTATRPQAVQRRQDFVTNTIDSDNLRDDVRFTPLVRFKQTRTNRRRLFVPNFFG